MTREPTRVTVLGLGEAGHVIAAGLADRGFAVHAYDPRPRPAPPGVIRCADVRAAVADTAAVLALTAARDAGDALREAVGLLPAGALYADLATTAPALKRELAGIARQAGHPFVDVALMGTVTATGIATPQLAAGDGAEAYARLLAHAGANVVVVSDHAGDAATRKLLRSVVFKSLGAALIESLRAAEAAGLSTWLWEHLAHDSPLEEAFLRRLVDGTARHAERRSDEMRATVELLQELGIAPTMTTAALRSLEVMDVQALGDLVPDEGDD